MFLHSANGLGKILVGSNSVSYWLWRLFAAEVVGNVARVTERTGEVTFKDIALEVCVLSAAHRIDEILVMAGGPGKLLRFLPLRVINDRRIIIGDYHVTTFAIDHDADAAAVVVV